MFIKKERDWYFMDCRLIELKSAIFRKSIADIEVYFCPAFIVACGESKTVIQSQYFISLSAN